MYAYYYHENSDTIFIDHFRKDFGPIENDTVHRIGIAFRENDRIELIKRLKREKCKGRFKGLLLSHCTVSLEFPSLPF